MSNIDKGTAGHQMTILLKDYNIESVYTKSSG